MRFYLKLTLWILVWGWCFVCLVGATIIKAQNSDLIAYTQNSGGNTDIYLMNANGNDQRQLTSNTAGDSEPAWSPDRQQIAFISDRDGSPEVYLMSADGYNQHRLSTDNAFAGNPSWSPDGQRIVYESYRGGSSQILIISVNGGNAQSLTDGSAEDVDPAWSPDGRQIAFASSRRGNFEIYLMDANGGNVRQVSSNPSGDNRSPAWSPDGTRIAFVSTYGRDSEVNMMNADGRDLRPIAVNGNLFSDVVTWSPDGQSVAYMVWTAQGDRYIQVSGVNEFATRRLASDAGWPSWASPRPITIDQGTNSGGSSDGSFVCPNVLAPRLRIGDRATVTPGLPNRLRRSPSLAGEQIGRVQPGRTFTILDGPVCADGYVWWQISFDGQIGWTVEATPNEYWIVSVQ